MGKAITRLMVLAALLTGCVDYMYEPVPGRVPVASAYDANWACAGVVRRAGLSEPTVPGLLPTLLVMSSPEGQARRAARGGVVAGCMASYGWVER